MKKPQQPQRTTCVLSLSIWIILYCCDHNLCAQDSVPSWSLHGSASLNADYYSLAANPPSLLQARRPANLYRFILNTAASYGVIELPITLVVSSQQTNLSTPYAPDQSITQFIQNPLNVFAFEPRFGWCKAHIGSYIPRFTELSVGDVQIFGAGLECSPGKLIFSTFYGVSQRAIEQTIPTTSFNLGGAYRRTMMGLRLGRRRADRGSLSFQAVYAIDDTASVKTPLLNTNAQEFLVTSLATVVDIDTSVILEAEIAGNINSRSLRSQVYNGSDYTFFSPITVRYSTRLDYAASAGLHFNFTSWNLRAAAKYIGDGFVSPGFPYMQPDRMELTLQPSARLMQNALQLYATVGYRINNLLSRQAETLKQILIASNVSWVYNEEWTVSASFSNFGVRNAAINDTVRIQNVSRSFSLSPSYSFANSLGRQTISITGGVDNFEDFNLLSRSVTTNNTRSAFLNYSIGLNEIPLGGYGGLSYVANDVPLAAFTTVSANIGASYNVRALKLSPGLRFSFASTSFIAGNSHTQFLVGISCGYALSSATTLSLTSSVNFFSFSTKTSYTEGTMQAIVATRF